MWSGGVVFCKDKTMGRKQPELPRCPHETISFRLGFNSRDLEIKKGNRRSGRRFLKAASQQDFSGPVSFAASLSLPLPPLLLWGINTFQRMSSGPLTGECALHSGSQGSCKRIL